jgi:hypothetical protein
LEETSMSAYAGSRSAWETELSLEETLRTVALALDASRTPRVRLTIEATGITLDAPATLGLRTYTWDALAREARCQQAQRAREARAVPWLDSWALTRWGVLLRLTGRLLDARGMRACRISAAVAPPAEPQTCELRVQVAEDTVLDADAVVAELQRLRGQHGIRRAGRAAGLAAPAPPRQPWWARWLPVGANGS